MATPSSQMASHTELSGYPGAETILLSNCFFRLLETFISKKRIPYLNIEKFCSKELPLSCASQENPYTIVLSFSFQSCPFLQQAA